MAAGLRLPQARAGAGAARAAAELGLDLRASLLAGDRGSDIAAGRAAGVGRCFLIGGDGEARAAGADGAFASLLDCAKAVLR